MTNPLGHISLKAGMEPELFEKLDAMRKERNCKNWRTFFAQIVKELEEKK